MRWAKMNEKIDIYIKGYESGWEIGRQAERKYILHQAEQAAMENEIGQYVYLSDLRDYIEEDNEQAKKNS